MNKRKQDYYIGLDMGTNSVGWAVTDPSYHLLRAKGKDMWGIREFDAAISAAERRTHRISRRNRQRRQVRIGLLQSYFEEAIMQEDSNFYIRLKNSFYKENDKPDELDSLDAIFADSDYHDSDYYKDYPTIFHLKYDLIKDICPVDSRYTRKLFLAILNYYKHRGHFLNSSLSGDGEEVQDVWTAFKDACEVIERELDFTVDCAETAEKGFKTILMDSRLSRSRRRESLMDLFQVKRNTQVYYVLTAICGLKTDLIKLLGIEHEQKVTLEFSAADFEEKLPEIYSVIGDGYSPVIESLKAVYDAGVLSSIMEGVSWLSEARLRDYEKHKADLQLLKRTIRKYCDFKEYNALFREDVDGGYSAYIGSLNSDRKVRRGERLRKSKANDRYDNLKKRIKKDLEAYKEDKDVAYILKELDADSFLPKQLTFANGVIPNQLHERELRQILKNASKHLDFLNKIDESGLTVAERIICLFTFQIPYYIGPLSQNYKGNGWVVRKPGMDNKRVYPWNIKDVVDYEATNEEFIHRMVRECTYISGEKVLPKESLRYQTFMVLNTINNLKIKNERIPVKLKQEIFDDIFKSGKRITKSKIAKYLKSRGVLEEETDLSGIDTNIGCQLSTYSKFFALFGEDMKKDSIKKMVEQIVFWGTVYGDSKTMFKAQIMKHYGNEAINDYQLKRILGFKFRDWGRLSREFLELPGCNKETGEVTSLIRALWEDEDNLNMMELLHSDKYTFGQSLDEKHNNSLKTLSEFKFEDLNGMYFSAPVKRMIWQTLLIIKEIEKIMGYPPSRIFVEMTRTNEEKGDAGRKDSREKELLSLYKAIHDDRDWKKEIEKAGGSGKLRSKKMYLYYKQLGRDMYTGQPIDLSELFDDNKYDIDHIFPRHFVKDDSIHNNLVLVDKRKNSRKSDSYPIDSDIRNNPEVYRLWKVLREKNFINEEKYRRLTGNKPFSEEQKADFIARQMVETGQATKGVNDLLKQLLPKETILVYSKAGNVSDFRRDYGFFKSRMLNDFHHAHDAYLNIVVGNVYFTKFTSNPLNFIKKDHQKYHLGNMFDNDVSRNGYTAWIAPLKDQMGNIIETRESLKTVSQMLCKNTPILTRLSLTQHGAISDATIYSAERSKADSYLPVKSTDSRLQRVEEYGGFNKAKMAYFFLVEHEVPGKGKKKGAAEKIRTIECVPVYKQSQIESNVDGLYKYCLELGLKNPSIRIKKIKPQSLIKVNGFPLYITGKSEKRFVVRNACNLILDRKWQIIVHNLEKYTSSGIISRNLNEEAANKLYDLLTYKHSDSIFSKRPNPIKEILKNGHVKFVELPLENKLYVISQIMNLSMICNSALADLRLIGGSSKSGVTLINKQISNFESAILVNQSVTGLYQREVDLLTV